MFLPFMQEVSRGYTSGATTVNKKYTMSTPWKSELALKIHVQL